MDTQINQFKNILKSNSLYVTDQRIQLFILLYNEERPISLPKLAKKLSNDLDLVTIYRSVDTLEKLEVIKKVYTGWKYKVELSEKFRPHHHHLTCNNCSKVFDLDQEPELENALIKISKKYSFKINSHEFELYGICKNCS